MGLGSWFSLRRKDTCELHGAGRNSANRTLLAMVAACCAIIVWHVWAYGPTRPNGTVQDESLLLQVGRECWDLVFNAHGIVAELRDVFPYFLVGILLAGYLRTYKIAVKLQASLRRYGALSVVVASFVGIITPLCACGTLTTAISLLFAGLPLAPVMAILVTSPLMSPSTYLLTLNDLGPEWTVIRTIAAFTMGIFAGYVTHLLSLRGFDKGGVFVDGGIVRGDFHDEDYPDERLRCNCRQRFGNRVAVRTSNKFIIFLAKSVEMVGVVGKYILVGVIIGAIVERYMPYEWIYRFFGTEDPLNILWVTLGTVPIFLHQISASSILVHIKQTLNGTLDAGAALAFMIGGPVTAIPTMVLFWTVFKRRFFVLYLSVCLVGTIAISLAFQSLVFIPGVDLGNQLLSGVSRLAGGPSTTIVKEGNGVRIVLAPQGKSIVATYNYDVLAHGGVVFDASLARLTPAGPSTGDNMRYIANIAEWLEQSCYALEKKSILLYDPVVGPATSGQGLAALIADTLRRHNYTVTVATRRDLANLTEQKLATLGQLWLLFPSDASAASLSDKERSAIIAAVEQGTSMLLAVDSGSDPSLEPATANQLATHFGVRFTGSVVNEPQIPVAIGSSFFTAASDLLGKVLKIVHKA